jgi:hypothetical protein
MTTNNYTPRDAIFILEAVARILETSHSQLSETFAEQHAGYLRDAARSVADELDLRPDHGDSDHGAIDEWTCALLPILHNTPAQIREHYARIKG